MQISAQLSGYMPQFGALKLWSPYLMPYREVIDPNILYKIFLYKKLV